MMPCQKLPDAVEIPWLMVCDSSRKSHNSHTPDRQQRAIAVSVTAVCEKAVFTESPSSAPRRLVSGTPSPSDRARSTCSNSAKAGPYLLGSKTLTADMLPAARVVANPGGQL